MKARRYRLLSTLARKREARASHELIVSFAEGLIRQTTRSQWLHVRRSNTGVNVDGLTRRVAPIDEALGRKR